MSVVCTPYPRHIGSASIAIRAAAAQRPVLASDYGWLGAIVPRFDLGWITDVCRPEIFSKSLSEALEQSRHFKPSSRSLGYVKYSSVPNFKAHWTTGLRMELGLPQPDSYQQFER
jgi:hypothetical protein